MPNLPVLVLLASLDDTKPVNPKVWTAARKRRTTRMIKKHATDRLAFFSSKDMEAAYIGERWTDFDATPWVRDGCVRDRYRSWELIELQDTNLEPFKTHRLTIKETEFTGRCTGGKIQGLRNRWSIRTEKRGFENTSRTYTQAK